MKKFTAGRNSKMYSNEIFFEVYADDMKISVFEPHSIDILRSKAVVNYLVEYLDEETASYTLSNIIKKDAVSKFVDKILAKYINKEISYSYTSHMNADGLYEVVNTKDIDIDSIFNTMLSLMLDFIILKENV